MIGTKPDTRDIYAPPKAFVFIHKQDGFPVGTRLLMLKREPHCRMFPCRWNPPGGGVEPKDFPDEAAGNFFYLNVLEAAAVREALEETGLEVGLVRCLDNAMYFHLDQRPAVVGFFHTAYVRGAIKLDEESTEYKWLTYEELIHLDQEDEMMDGIFPLVQTLFTRLRLC